LIRSAPSCWSEASPCACASCALNYHDPRRALRCSVTPHVARGPKHWDRYGLKSWIEAAKKGLHHNVLAIALAKKLARIAWSVLAHGRTFEASKIKAA